MVSTASKRDSRSRHLRLERLSIGSIHSSRWSGRRHWRITSMSRANCLVLFSTWLYSLWQRRSMALANWGFTCQRRNRWLDQAFSIESSVWSAGGAIFMSGCLWLALFWPCRKRRSLSWHSGKSQLQPLISCTLAGYFIFSDARGSTDLPLG